MCLRYIIRYLFIYYKCYLVHSYKQGTFDYKETVGGLKMVKRMMALIL